MNRNKEIIKTSVIGIAANIFLALFKTIVGLIANSTAIIMDALNNLSDAMSSVITIVGTKLSERPADRKHPFGYGRVEYFSAIIISIIVLIAGCTSLIESFKKLIHPSQPTYTTFTLIVIIVAIFVKIALGQYVKRKGQKLKSDSLIASGADAMFDALITLSTLLSAGIMLIWNVNLDGAFSTFISLVIIKAGIDMLGGPISELLGKSISKEFIQNIKHSILEFKEVNGVFDVILNYYGPQTIIGSANISVVDTMTARQIHGLTRNIMHMLYEKYGIIANIGIYAINTSGHLMELQQRVMKTVFEHEHVIEVHGFYVYEETKSITLDIVTDDAVTDDEAFLRHIEDHLKEVEPKYNYQLIMDHNYKNDTSTNA
ncbi:cation diffusion facilitator family transporter [Prevotella sp.]|uniref:cation diffusion facilitator family transporter n=1 Tax=Prevotella sp. TaxID=59823 RepID=UPI002F9205D0